MNKHTSKRAFTLIELIVTIGIISTLSITALVTISGTGDRAKLVKLTSEINDIKRIAYQYRADIGEWPATEYIPCTTCAHFTNPFMTNPFTVGSPEYKLWKGPYIQKFPNNHPWNGYIGFRSCDQNSDGVIERFAIFAYDGELGNTYDNTGIPIDIISLFDKKYDDGIFSSGNVQTNVFDICGYDPVNNEFALILD